MAQFRSRPGWGCWDIGGRPKRSAPLHGFLDPLQVAADFGIDTGLGGRVAGDITPGQGSVQAAPEDSKVWSRVSWAGQEQLLSFSESPSLRTGSVPGMQ